MTKNDARQGFYFDVMQCLALFLSKVAHLILRKLYIL